jgi:hypothetical protein
MDGSVRVIGSQNFEEEVVLEKWPVLLLRMPRDEAFFRQVKVLEEATERHGQALRIGLLEDEFLISTHPNRVDILGFRRPYNPTFLHQCINLYPGGAALRILLNCARSPPIGLSQPYRSLG